MTMDAGCLDRCSDLTISQVFLNINPHGLPLRSIHSFVTAEVNESMLAPRESLHRGYMKSHPVASTHSKWQSRSLHCAVLPCHNQS